MIMFAILLFFIIITYPFFKKKCALVSGEIIKTNNRSYIYIVSFALISLLGLRGVSVGIDTVTYNNIYNSTKYLSLSQTLDQNIEYGYSFFEYVVNVFFGDFQFLLIIVAFLFIGVVSYHIYKYSKNPMLSYALFIVYGFYSFAMSATRQTIAIALVMIAYEYMKKKKLLKFIICVFLASSFHISALIFLPVYWFNKFELNKKAIFILFLLGLLLLGFKDEFQTLLNSYARIEYSAIETGGNGMYIFMLISVLLGIIYRKPFAARNENNKYLLYMMVSALLIMPITQFHPAVMRLYFYFFIFLIIYIPNILSSINDRLIRNVGVGLYFITGVIWFFTSIIHIEKLESYMFFWQ